MTRPTREQLEAARAWLENQGKLAAMNDDHARAQHVRVLLNATDARPLPTEEQIARAIAGVRAEDHDDTVTATDRLAARAVLALLRGDP